MRELSYEYIYVACTPCILCWQSGELREEGWVGEEEARGVQVEVLSDGVTNTVLGIIHYFLGGLKKTVMS